MTNSTDEGVAAAHANQLRSTARRWLLSLAVIGMVLISGTTVGDVVPLLRTMNAALGAAVIVMWVPAVRRTADMVDQLTLAALLLFLVTAVASSFARQSLDAAMAAIAWTAAFGVARHELRSPVMRAQLLMVLGALGVALSIAVAVLWGSVWIEWLSLTSWRSAPPLDLRLPSAIWGHRHDLTALLAVLAPAVWLGRGRGARQAIAYVALAAAAAVVIMDGSRTVWAALVGASVVAGVGPLALRLLRRRWVLVAAVVILVAVAAFAALGGLDEVLRRVTTLRTLEVRAAQWVDALEVWRRDPLQGAGPGSFPFVLRLTDYFEANAYISRHPDNGYVQLLTEVGLLGAGAALLVCAAVVARWRQGGAAGQAAKWVLAFVLLMGLGMNPFEYGFLIVPILLWAALGTSTVGGEADDLRPIPAIAGTPRAVRMAAAAGLTCVAGAFLSLTAAAFAFQQAAAYEAAGSYRDAEQALNVAVSLDPGMALYRRERGAARLLGGDPGRAIGDFARATQMNPADDTAFRGLALAREGAGTPLSALAAARTSVALDAADPLNQLVLARLAWSAGHGDLAWAALSRVLLVYPWIAADPNWVQALPDGVSTAPLLAFAERAWARGTDVALAPLTPSWLVGLSRIDDDAAAVLAAKGLDQTSTALLDLFGCRIDRASRSIADAESSEGASESYWTARLLIDKAAGRSDVRAASTAFVRLPQLRPVVEGQIPSSDPFSGGFQDQYGYRRLRVAHGGVRAGPSPLGGLQAWLADPFAAALRSSPAVPLATCAR